MTDEPKPESHRRDSSEAAPDSNNEKVVDQTQHKKVDNQHATGEAKASAPKRRFQRIRTWWKDPFRTPASWTDKAIVFLTFGIVLLAIMQWRETIAGSNQTDKLIQAAKINACAAQKIADASGRNATAAEGFATSASDINAGVDGAVTQMQNAVGQLQTMAASSEKSIENTQDAMRLDQRAWLGVSTVNVLDPSAEKGFPVSIIFIDSGRTPANKVQFAAGYHYSSTPILGPSSAEIGKLTFDSVQSVAPQADFNGVLGYVTATGDMSSPSDLTGYRDILSKFQDILDHKLTLYYYGTVKYDDVFGNQRSTNFCIYLADPKLKIAAFCRDFNDLN